MPSSYFDAETIRALAQFETLARAKRDLDLMGAFPTKLDVKRALAGSWQNSTTIVFRNWLTYLSAHRAAKAIS